MGALEAISERVPEHAKDLRLNLSSVLGDGSLNEAQRYGVALACAIAARNADLRGALTEEAHARGGDALVDDARAAASLMAMNNVTYRFRHSIGKDEYETKRMGLRMNRLTRVATNKADFELMCLAVSAINNCERCVRAHEKVVLEAGLSSDQVWDAIRIAGTLYAVAVALESL